MRLSKFLLNGLALSLSACSIAAADSPQLSRALDGLSSISDDVKSATTAINLYQGGALAALPAAKKFYDLWNNLKKATADLDGEADVPPEDSTKLMEELEDMEPTIRKAMEASGDKLPALDKAGVGFVSLALHEGVKRDLKSYLSTLRPKLPENEQSRVDDLWSTYSEIHDSTVGA